jgi:hypothetical protein
MRVVKLTQTRPTPFQGGVQGPPSGTSFKHKHLELSICQVKGLDINRTQGLTIQSCQTF